MYTFIHYILYTFIYIKKCNKKVQIANCKQKSLNCDKCIYLFLFIYLFIYLVI